MWWIIDVYNCFECAPSFGRVWCMCVCVCYWEMIVTSGQYSLGDCEEAHMLCPQRIGKCLRTMKTKIESWIYHLEIENNPTNWLLHVWRVSNGKETEMDWITASKWKFDEISFTNWFLFFGFFPGFSRHMPRHTQRERDRERYSRNETHFFLRGNSLFITGN